MVGKRGKMKEEKKMVEEKMIEDFVNWVKEGWEEVERENKRLDEECKEGEECEIGFGDLVNNFGCKLFRKMEGRMNIGELEDCCEGMREVVKRFDIEKVENGDELGYYVEKLIGVMKVLMSREDDYIEICERFWDGVWFEWDKKKVVRFLGWLLMMMKDKN